MTWRRPLGNNPFRRETRGDGRHSSDAGFAVMALGAILYGTLGGVIGDSRLPGALIQPVFSLDVSYQVAFGAAYERGLRFGDEITFTYGPLGFLAGVVRPPAVLPLVLLFGTVLCGVLVGLVVGLSRRAPIPWWVALLGFCVLISLLRELELRLYALAVLYVVYLQTVEDGSAPLLVLGAMLLGAAALVKFTFFPLGVGVAAVLAVGRRLAGHRRAFFYPAIILATPLLVWLGLYGDLWGYGSFLASSFEIMRGYGSAMQVDGPAIEVVVYLAMCTMLLGLELAVPPPRAWIDRATAVAALTVVLAGVFKHAFVRQASHVVIGWSIVLVLAAVTALLRARSPHRAVRAMAPCVLLVAAALHVYGMRHRPDYYPAIASADVIGLGRHAATALDLLLGDGLAAEQARWDAVLDEVAAANPLPAARGSVDLYPWDLRLLFAHRLDWRPRPILQSYATYSEGLLRRNAEHLRDAGADHILFSVRTIDERYPSLDDGPSWPVLLSSYDSRELAGDYLALDRRSAPRSIDLAPLATREARFGEEIAVPPAVDGAVWAVIDLGPTLLGHVRDALYRMPIVQLVVQLENGPQRSFRFVPGMGRAGFLLSPLVEHGRDLLPLFARDRAAIDRLPRVRAITITGEGGDLPRFYRDRVQVRFEALLLPHDEPAGQRRS